MKIKMILISFIVKIKKIYNLRKICIFRANLSWENLKMIEKKIVIKI